MEKPSKMRNNREKTVKNIVKLEINRQKYRKIGKNVDKLVKNSQNYKTGKNIEKPSKI